jgi:hypothetical protein
LKNESVVAFLIVLVIVSGGMGVLSWTTNPSTSTYGSTTTTTQTIPCPTSLTTQTTSTTSTGTNRLPSFGPLLGNFSSISVMLYGHTPTGGSYTSLTFAVLNRSSSSSGPTYLLNITGRTVGPNVTTEETQEFTTTIASANQTWEGSLLGHFASNGSLISTEKTSGNLSSAGLSLLFLYPMISLNFTSSNNRLHVVNNTIVTIGSTRMVVTNYEFPSEVLVQVLEGCDSVPPINSTSTISYLGIQAGRVPGTNFILTTQISETLTLQSNPLNCGLSANGETMSCSSSSATSVNLSLTWRVTSFSIAR